MISYRVTHKHITGDEYDFSRPRLWFVKRAYGSYEYNNGLWERVRASERPFIQREAEKGYFVEVEKEKQ